MDRAGAARTCVGNPVKLDQVLRAAGGVADRRHQRRTAGGPALRAARAAAPTQLLRRAGSPPTRRHRRASRTCVLDPAATGSSRRCASTRVPDWARGEPALGQPALTARRWRRARRPAGLAGVDAGGGSIAAGRRGSRLGNRVRTPGSQHARDRDRRRHLPARRPGSRRVGGRPRPRRAPPADDGAARPARRGAGRPRGGGHLPLRRPLRPGRRLPAATTAGTRCATSTAGCAQWAAAGRPVVGERRTARPGRSEHATGHDRTTGLRAPRLLRRRCRSTPSPRTCGPSTRAPTGWSATSG